MVCSEILESGASCTVSWDDIAGQEPAKRLVQELGVWPMLNPCLFKVRGPEPLAAPFQNLLACALQELRWPVHLQKPLFMADMLAQDMPVDAVHDHPVSLP